MSFLFSNLDGDTRKYMIEEFDTDIENGTVYISKSFNEIGSKTWPKIFREAIISNNIEWLIDQMKRIDCLNEYESYVKNDIVRQRKVSSDALTRFVEGEFNRYYIRGLAKRAIAEKIESLIVYRGKEVSHPRPESEELIGKKVDPNDLLTDLRKNIGIDTVLGIPKGPNSGLTVKLP